MPSSRCICLRDDALTRQVIDEDCKAPSHDWDNGLVLA